MSIRIINIFILPLLFFLLPYCGNAQNLKGFIDPISKKVGFKSQQTGEIVIPAKYEMAYNFNAVGDNEFLAPAKLNGVWGFIDQGDKTVVPFGFEDAKGFSNGRAAVKQNSRWGFINQIGKLVINPQFENARNFSENYSSVQINKKWGFIDSMGKFKIPIQFDTASGFNSGLAAVRKDMLWGFIDKSGKTAIPYQYNAVSSFTNDTTEVAKEGKAFLIDRNGAEITAKNIVQQQYFQKRLYWMQKIADDWARDNAKIKEPVSTKEKKINNSPAIEASSVLLKDKIVVSNLPVSVYEDWMNALNDLLKETGKVNNTGVYESPLLILLKKPDHYKNAPQSWFNESAVKKEATLFIKVTRDEGSHKEYFNSRELRLLLKANKIDPENETEIKLFTQSNNMIFQEEERDGIKHTIIGGYRPDGAGAGRTYNDGTALWIYSIWEKSNNTYMLCLQLSGATVYMADDQKKDWILYLRRVITGFSIPNF